MKRNNILIALIISSQIFFIPIRAGIEHNETASITEKSQDNNYAKPINGPKIVYKKNTSYSFDGFSIDGKIENLFMLFIRHQKSFIYEPLFDVDSLDEILFNEVAVIPAKAGIQLKEK